MYKENVDAGDSAICELRKLSLSNDTEAAHEDADDVLCKLLIALGYPEVVQEFNKIKKWYA